jgi:hypothetical protein
MSRFNNYTDWHDALDDLKGMSDREGEEDYDLGDQCRHCFNGQHQRCTRQSGTFAGRPCSCYQNASPVFHPRKTGKLKLVMESLENE